MPIETIIFDLGGVLIDWNPRYVYRTLFATEAEVDNFLTHICTSEWNEAQDAGRPLAEATEWLVAQHPAWEREIRAYYGRWKEMIGGEISGTVALLERLVAMRQHRLYALTNWSAETFPYALGRFGFLHHFEGIVVSGVEQLKKPDVRIYELLLSRYHIDPTKAIFIDDSARNVAGARHAGLHAIHFQHPAQLQAALSEWGVW